MSDEAPKKDLTLLTDLPLVDPPAPDAAPPQESAPEFETTPPAEPQADNAFDFIQPEQPEQSGQPEPSDSPAGINLDFAPVGEIAAPEPIIDAPAAAEIAPPPSPTPDPEKTLSPEPVELLSQDAWNLSITAAPGALRPEHRARLLDLITRESIGIREVDLEPQFESGRIFLPRMSEYLGITLVQALRDATVQIRFEPASSELDSRQDMRDFDHPAHATHSSQTERSYVFDQILLTADSSLPGISTHQLSPIDVLVVSATLTHAEVESRHDVLHAHVFEDRLESLKRELKARAFYRGAHAVLNFSLELQALKDPALYKLILSGTAARLNAGGAKQEPSPEQPH